MEKVNFSSPLYLFLIIMLIGHIDSPEYKHIVTFVVMPKFNRFFTSFEGEFIYYIL